MKLSSTLIGRGLLAIALSGYMVACGDDDSKDSKDGGGGSGGTSGVGGNDPDAGGKGGAGAGGDTTPQECKDGFKAIDTTPFNTACTDCTCDTDAEAAAMCNEDCFALINCIINECSGSGSDIACITGNCMAYIAGGATGAMAIIGTMGAPGPISSCSDCALPVPPDDAGTDGG